MLPGHGKRNSHLHMYQCFIILRGYSTQTNNPPQTPQAHLHTKSLLSSRSLPLSDIPGLEIIMIPSPSLNIAPSSLSPNTSQRGFSNSQIVGGIVDIHASPAVTKCPEACSRRLYIITNTCNSNEQNPVTCWSSAASSYSTPLHTKDYNRSEHIPLAPPPRKAFQGSPVLHSPAPRLRKKHLPVYAS